MASTQTESEFFKKAATVGALVATGAAAWGVAQTVSNGISEADREADLKAAHEQEQQFHDALAEKIQGQFGEMQVIGSPFSLEQSEGLLDKSLDQISTVYHDDFDNLKPLIYDTLKTASVLQGAPQPGERFVVIEDDIDPEKDNGKEYFPVRESQVVHTDIDALPTPETH
jgi:hypothetical protein